MQKYWNTVLNERGEPRSGARVAVQQSGSNSTVYSDQAGSEVKTNPLTTDSKGYFEFYAASGEYDLVVTGTGFDDYTITDGALVGMPSDDVSFVQSGSEHTRNAQDKLREIVSPEDDGAVGDGSTTDTTGVADCLARSSSLINVVNTYKVGSFTLANDVTAMGDGYIIGTAVSGSKPTRAELTGAVNAAARLTDLETYYTAVITITANIKIRGNLELRDCLIKSASGHTLTVEGRLILSNVSFHKIQLKADKGGVIDSSGLLSTDSTGVGLWATNGGKIYAPSAGVTHCADRGCMAANAGFIDVTSGEIYNSTKENIYAIFNGTVIATAAKANVSTTDGVAAYYGGSVDISTGQASDNTSDGIVCESNSTVYAVSTTIDGNDATGITTTRGGVVNANLATITNSGTYAAHALGGGYIDLDDATVDTTNTGVGGLIVRATGNGYIFAEEPGVGTGKTTLAATNYGPGYNRLGNGAAYIGIAAQNDTMVNTPAYVIGNAGPSTATIASDDVTITDRSSWWNFDTEAAGATDSLDTIIGGQIGQVIVIQSANSNRDITVNNNGAGAGSSILLAGGAGFTLSNVRDSLTLQKDTDGFWVEIARTDVA